MQGRSDQFVNKLLKWVTQNAISQIVVLTSSYADERRDKDILRYIIYMVLSNEKAFKLKKKYICNNVHTMHVYAAYTSI